MGRRNFIQDKLMDEVTCYLAFMDIANEGRPVAPPTRSVVSRVQEYTPDRNPNPFGFPPEWLA